MTIDVGNALGYSMLNAVDAGKGGVLTLGADASLVQTGYEATLQDGDQAADGIVNLGTIMPACTERAGSSMSAATASPTRAQSPSRMAGCSPCSRRISPMPAW